MASMSSELRLGGGCRRMVALAVAMLFAITLSCSSAAASCENRLQEKILGMYVEAFHEVWGEQSSRASIDELLSEMAPEIRVVLGKEYPSCRFSETVRRSPPKTFGGPTVAKDVATIDVSLEFTSQGEEFCIGLNNIGKIGVPTDGRYPFVLQSTKSKLRFVSPHYAMKCFGRSGANGRYLYY